jgi:hypothetical protein
MLDALCSALLKIGLRGLTRFFMLKEMPKMSRELIRGKHSVSRMLLALIALALCGAVNVYSASQLAVDNLTDADKSEIISSILEEELRPAAWPAPGFHVDRYVSRENIEFFQLAYHLTEGFKLIERAALKEKLEGEDFECMVFREFAVTAGKVTIGVTRIAAAFSCYGGYITSQQELSYEYRKVSGRWTGNLIDISPHQALRINRTKNN